jgi:hypothetical protein
MCSIPSDLYYLAFPKDRLSTKCLVYGVYALEVVETILVTHDSFAAFGYGFGDISALTRIDFNWLSIPIMSGLGNFDAKSSCLALTSAALIHSCFHWAGVLRLPYSCVVKILPSSGIDRAGKRIRFRVLSDDINASQVSLISSIGAFISGAFSFEGAIFLVLIV